MNIIIHADNADELESFVPVLGTWALDEISSDEFSIEDIETSIKNWMNVDYKIKVSLFKENGREIIDYLPLHGNFLAIRI